ncbi:undecaprenyl-diphosphatase UppP [Candidatus Peregrinibacteria bacterium]|nr:undecaprenyl-diphosphatase UppP [Candidatus Peregrinibacteria bacterium]
MEFSDSLILGILQGITEFLPVSSSGHLVLGEYYLGLNVETLKSFDVVVHLGTLLAILVYFKKDVWEILKALGRLFCRKFEKKDPYLKLILFIVIGTVPAVIFAILGEKWIDNTFRNVKAVGIWMFIVGIIYLIGEFAYKRRKNHKMNYRKAFVIGMVQALALIPGVSRSGSTITAGLFQGIERSSAARFSFLLGIPAIVGAGLFTAVNLPENGIEISIIPLFTGFFTSFIFGLLSVAFLMRFLKRNSLIVFSIYLIALGISVFV